MHASPNSDPAAGLDGRLARARRRSTRRTRDPLTLWRTTHPARITRADVDSIARRLAATEILHERRWRRARAGDAAAAAAIAIDHLRGLREGNALSDLVLGNLVVLAVRGDATAPVILSHALSTLGRIDPTDSRLPRLAASWIHRSSRRQPRRDQGAT